ncbi:riboflavin kinase/FMN adenylyltransferase [Paenibacillus sp. yr247]|uniref:FAD synthetase family protein n=1 Tax=Paenibacillus sp. yr247 TaxID=1761880 RepID=UPI000891444C|nr:FAD synthetase family protein [Paenibacillus sp. yr247]SDP16928.1 riboflavin kinase/FMN adenylyltransferase [Paenibacillus sp. yr247]
MKIVQFPSEVPKKGNGSWVAIGKWDGIHLGHQHLVEQIVRRARSNGGQSVVISFDRHPAAVLRPGTEPFQLQSVTARSTLLASLGVDVHLVLPFTREFADLSPEKFVEDILITNIQTCDVTIGYNFRFGKERVGTPEILEQLCAKHGIAVHVASPIVVEGEVVSSTLIRSYLQLGQVERASRLLGRPDFLMGTGYKLSV